MCCRMRTEDSAKVHQTLFLLLGVGSGDKTTKPLNGLGDDTSKHMARYHLHAHSQAFQCCMLKAEKLGLGRGGGVSLVPRIDIILCSIRVESTTIGIHCTTGLYSQYSLTSVWLIHLYIMYSISRWRRQGGDWFGALWGNGCYRCDCPSPATPTSAGNTGQSGWTVEPLHMLLISSR